MSPYNHMIFLKLRLHKVNGIFYKIEQFTEKYCAFFYISKTPFKKGSLY